MRYEFSGLYMFGLPLPALDHETPAASADRLALERGLTEMLVANAAAVRADEPRMALSGD